MSAAGAHKDCYTHIASLNSLPQVLYERSVKTEP